MQFVVMFIIFGFSALLFSLTYKKEHAAYGWVLLPGMICSWTSLTDTLLLHDLNQPWTASEGVMFSISAAVVCASSLLLLFELENPHRRASGCLVFTGLANSLIVYVISLYGVVTAFVWAENFSVISMSLFTLIFTLLLFVLLMVIWFRAYQVRLFEYV